MTEHPAITYTIVRCQVGAKQQPNETGTTSHERNFTREYTLQTSNGDRRVCKNCYTIYTKIYFLHTLQISNGRLDRVLVRNRNNVGIVKPDERGKHCKKIIFQIKKGTPFMTTLHTFHGICRITRDTSKSVDSTWHQTCRSGYCTKVTENTAAREMFRL